MLQNDRPAAKRADQAGEGTVGRRVVHERMQGRRQVLACGIGDAGHGRNLRQPISTMMLP